MADNSFLFFSYLVSNMSNYKGSFTKIKLTELYRSFSAHHCGGTLTAQRYDQTIESPNYNNAAAGFAYDTDTNCGWLIQVGFTFIL